MSRLMHKDIIFWKKLLESWNKEMAFKNVKQACSLSRSEYQKESTKKEKIQEIQTDYTNIVSLH